MFIQTTTDDYVNTDHVASVRHCHDGTFILYSATGDHLGAVTERALTRYLERTGEAPPEARPITEAMAEKYTRDDEECIQEAFSRALARAEDEVIKLRKELVEAKSGEWNAAVRKCLEHAVTAMSWMHISFSVKEEFLKLLRSELRP